ncbi:putative potassium transporter 8 [Coleophoma cylindrospora]|uniref:Putative potassium transporter 8 n=1 Tax=Coleophoma cylindrospora TaxID=1849047 RepID=A0A3D8RB70_9HELO|nr:putative potassium transporter 8 [Coleophoma cylindrospora]
MADIDGGLAQRIQFSEEINPATSGNEATYNSALRESKVSQKTTYADLEEQAIQIADADLNRKNKQTYTGWTLLWLAYQSTGVIYGDIGTSPLYVYSSTFTSQPGYDDLVGALSIIIWTLTFMVTIKYVFIVLSADFDGEGGSFALYSLLARYANIVRRDPNVAGTVKMERYLTGEISKPNKGLRSFIEKSTFARFGLKVLGILGVSMVMSDGVLTPAQSTLGAIQGIQVASSDITKSTIVGVTCAILILLFAIQPFGLTKIASSFAPIVMIWLLFNAICGIYNLAMHDHSVLKAFSPWFAGQYLMRNKEEGWRSLGGLLLAFTGVEALFADLGAFSKRAIQISWLCFTYPCLLLAYIGQAAYISGDTTDAYTNPFFNTVIPGTFYFSLVLAILAAIVASQAMITAAFQLLSQIMTMSYFPHIKTVHTSKKFHGQVYMPFANWLLMIGCVVVTAVYSDTTRLGNAYGVCVIFVTFITTCMVSLVAILVWRFNILIVSFFFLVFAALDGVYLSSALTKIPTGAWFTLVLAAILSSVFVLWRFGKEQQWASEAEDRFQPSHLLSPTKEGNVKLTAAYGGWQVSKIHGIGIFFDKVGDMVPVVFAQFVRKFSARPEVMIFFHMRPLNVPSIPEQERYVVQRTSIPNCYRLTIRHGYGDQIVTPDLGRLVVEQLILYITRDHSTPVSSSSPISSVEHSPEVQAELDTIAMAMERQLVYVMGKEQMKIRPGTNILRRVLLSAFLWIRENSRTKMADMNIPIENLVEIGFVKEI